ncbi:MAG: cupin domain-containing protein [Streptosporangiales bacterium]|nr:cupin domain-containing protein [Streptosporangiales bacterium]
MTVAQSTDAQALGARIRTYRRARDLSLRQLAQESGVSAGFLSQVERGRVNISISALRRVASSLRLTMADLFVEDGADRPRLLRRSERPLLSTEPSARKYLLSQRPLKYLEAYAAEFDPGGSTGSEQYTHGDAQELFVVVCGDVTVWLGDQVFEMSAGDSIEYSTATPHRAANNGDTVAEVLWLVAPPTFE